MDPWLLHVVSPPVGSGGGVCAAEAWCARPPHRTAAAGAQRELTHSQNELQLGGRLVLAPFEALNTEICVVSLRRASAAARERRFAGAVSSSELRLFVDVDDFQCTFFLVYVRTYSLLGEKREGGCVL